MTVVKGRAAYDLAYYADLCGGNMTPKYGEQVMVLNVRVHDEYYDMVGRFEGVSTVGTKRGLSKVNLMSKIFYLDAARIADPVAYFKAFNGDKSLLPAGASGKLYFMEGIKL